MRKLTQRELLDEGFWNFMNPRRSPILRTIGKTGAALTRMALPELARSVDRVEDAGKTIGTSLKSAIAGPYAHRPNRLNKVLEKQGYVLDPKNKIKQIDSKTILVIAYRIDDIDENTGKYTYDDTKPYKIIMKLQDGDYAPFKTMRYYGQGQGQGKGGPTGQGGQTP